MHDAKGRELKEGDVVVIPARVTRACGDENACCLDLETIGVMPCNGHKNKIYALSAKQVYRANEGDDGIDEIVTEEIDGEIYLIYLP